MGKSLGTHCSSCICSCQIRCRYATIASREWTQIQLQLEIQIQIEIQLEIRSYSLVNLFLNRFSLLSSLNYF